MSTRKWYWCALSSLLLAAPAAAQTADEGGEGPAIELPPDEPASGVAVNETTIGGYGEMHFNRVMPENGENSSEMDFHRMVVYLGRQFDAKLRFYSEIEVEHAIVGDGKPGEVALEQAYIEYQLADASSSAGEFGVRAGIVLVPMGIINQWHEPPVFHGVERPNVDKVVIPSTWREGGAGVYGSPIPELRYELYVVSGLDPAGFSAGSGLRGGRTKVGEARTDGLAFTGRVEYQLDTTTVLGLAGYYSQAGKNSELVQAADLDVNVAGFAADARTRRSGFEARAVFATFSIGDADELNALVDADGEPVSDVGDSTLGFYAEAAYDVLHTQPTTQQLLPFARYEYYRSHPDIDALAITDLVFGLSYRPIPQVVFKGDAVVRSPSEGDGATILNLGVGFLY